MCGQYKRVLQKRQSLYFVIFTGNIALGRPAAQSTTKYDAYASRAVDGNGTPSFSAQTCTHTYASDNPWWRVDLGNSVNVGEVSIANRGEGLGNRLDGFQIRVGVYI